MDWVGVCPRRQEVLLWLETALDEADMAQVIHCFLLLVCVRIQTAHLRVVKIFRDRLNWFVYPWVCGFVLTVTLTPLISVFRSCSFNKGIKHNFGSLD